MSSKVVSESRSMAPERGLPGTGSTLSTPVVMRQRELQTQLDASPRVGQLARIHSTIAAPHSGQVAQRYVTFNARQEEPVLLDVQGMAGYGESTIEGFAEDLLTYLPSGYSVEDVLTVFRDFIGTDRDISFRDFADAAQFVRKNALPSALATSSEEVEEDKVEAEVEEKKDEKKDEDSGGSTIKIGKQTYDTRLWHYTIKPAIIQYIGVKKLSRLAYGDSDHKNFDFWIGSDESIWVGGNGTGGHEKDTGVSIEDVTK